MGNRLVFCNFICKQLSKKIYICPESIENNICSKSIKNNIYPWYIRGYRTNKILEQFIYIYYNKVYYNNNVIIYHTNGDIDYNWCFTDDIFFEYNKKNNMINIRFMQKSSNIFKDIKITDFCNWNNISYDILFQSLVNDTCENYKSVIHRCIMEDMDIESLINF